MQLLKRVEIHLRRSGIAATQFGRDAVRDPRFVHDLRKGRQPRPRTVARVVGFIVEAEALPGEPKQ